MDERDVKLIEVVESGKLKQVEKTLNQGADPNARVGDMTALLAAAERGDPAIVALLVERGADVNRAGKSGKRALQLAVGAAHKEAAEVLLRNGASPDALDSWNRSALHHAVKSGSYETVKLLLEHDAKGFVVDREGDTPLHNAASCGHAQIIHLLLTRFDVKININAQNVGGKTALHFAGDLSDAALAAECSHLLTSHGAVDSIANARGEVPKAPKDVSKRNYVLRSPGLGASSPAAAAAVASSLASPRPASVGVTAPSPRGSRKTIVAAPSPRTVNGSLPLKSPRENAFSPSGAAAEGAGSSTLGRSKTMPPLASTKRRPKPEALANVHGSASPAVVTSPGQLTSPSAARTPKMTFRRGASAKQPAS